MNLFDKINEDLKQAMRDRDAFRLSVLRMLVAALKNKKIEMGQDTEMSDDLILSVLKSEVKKRRDSIVSYLEGKREDLAQKEKSEVEILEKYMPEMMSEEEIEKIVKEVIASVGATGPADFGKVMGAAMGKTKGQADGNVVSKVVKKSLETKS